MDTYALYNYSTGGGAGARDNHTCYLIRASGSLKLNISGANRGSSNRNNNYSIPEIGEAFHTLELQFLGHHPTVSFASAFKLYINGVRFIHGSAANYFYADNLQFNQFRLRGNNYVVYIAVFERSAARRKTTELEILKASNNSFPANPINKENLLLYWQCNQVVDETAISGNYLLQDFSGNTYNAVLSGFTANQLTDSNREYRVIPTNPLKDNTIHHTFSGDTVNAMNEQVNLLDGTTAPTDTYIFDGVLPIGLSLSASGTLTGTATQTGTFNLFVRLVDLDGNFEYKRIKIVIT